MNSAPTPLWSRFGLLSEWLLTATRSGRKSKTVLLISLPRSGSSWIGSVLGHTDNCAYLREPVTQRGLADGVRPVIRVIGRDATGKRDRHLARRALLGLPDKTGKITQHRSQWGLAGMRARTVLIKEVNPFALPMFLELGDPFVIVLVRHPAAVALSYQQRGWLGAPDTVANDCLDGSTWMRTGRHQAQTLQSMRLALTNHAHHCVVRYEDICANPMQQFAALATSAGLEFGDQAKKRIEQTTSGTKDGAGPFQIHRDTVNMPWRWKQEMSAATLAEIREGYVTADAGYYADPDHWRL